MTTAAVDTWKLPLPWRRPPLSANDRPHWTVRNRINQEIKTAAWALAKSKRVPHLDAVILELVWYPGNNRHHDGDNMAPTLKALTDGLVAAKVLADDNGERVLDARLRAVPRRLDPFDGNEPRMILVIRDASALAPLPHYGP